MNAQQKISPAPVRRSVRVKATPERAFEVFARQMGKWWPKGHSIGKSPLKDVIIEPQRHTLIPGFREVREAAMAAGALGCSISGAGPTMFAWSTEAAAEAVRGAMVAAFAKRGTRTDDWITRIDNRGARIVAD